MDSSLLSPSGRAALECVEAFVLSQLALGRQCEQKITQELEVLRQEMFEAMSKVGQPQRAVAHSIAFAEFVQERVSEHESNRGRA